MHTYVIQNHTVPYFFFCFFVFEFHRYSWLTNQITALKDQIELILVVLPNLRMVYMCTGHVCGVVLWQVSRGFG